MEFLFKAYHEEAQNRFPAMLPLTSRLAQLVLIDIGTLARNTHFVEWLRKQHTLEGETAAGSLPSDELLATRDADHLGMSVHEAVYGLNHLRVPAITQRR
jgi:hypothetical protein